ncbi:MAG: hypothetical protein ACRDBL_15135 [Rhabdaerophilum sp.]
MTGKAFLLFGNDIEPQMRSEYEAWHAGHHVPQRLEVPGILGAIRFRAEGEGRPEYLTLYRLAQVEVLESEAYRLLIERPDASTLAMRPHFRSPIRLVAEVAVVLFPPDRDWMSVEVSETCFPPACADVSSLHGRLVANQRNHPIMGAEPLPGGFIRLSFARRLVLSEQRIAPGARSLGGLYRPLDRFGVDSQ